jgi:hypothetical protein
LFYDLYTDARETQPKMLAGFTTKEMFNAMHARHEILIDKYPDNEEARDLPFTGVENVPPETIKASKPRVNQKNVPYDVQEVTKRSKDYGNFEADWGIQ